MIAAFQVAAGGRLYPHRRAVVGVRAAAHPQPVPRDARRGGDSSQHPEQRDAVSIGPHPRADFGGVPYRLGGPVLRTVQTCEPDSLTPRGIRRPDRHRTAGGERHFPERAADHPARR